MGKIKLKSFQLDDNTIIYIQANDNIDTTEITATLDAAPQALPETEIYESEDDLPDLPDPTVATPPSDTNYDDDEEIIGSEAKSKAWLKNRHSISQLADTSSQAEQSTHPTHIQRIGPLVKTYTNYLLSDLRDTALKNAEIEKVTLEFGVGLDTQLNAYVASTSLECTVKVAIECRIRPHSEG